VESWAGNLIENWVDDFELWIG